MDLQPSLIRDVLCRALRTTPDRSNWSEYPNVWGECQYLMEECPWYKVYDFVEALHAQLSRNLESDALRWEQLVNDYFVEIGVGWRLVEGQLESRGEEGFKAAVDTARASLEAAELPTARREIQEALKGLSRRPEPDLTGAIHHAMGALECTSREYTGNVKATLGEVLKKNPDLFPKPLDEALSKLWGYASEMARHIREGRSPEYGEAELAVTVAAAGCTYLASKLKKNDQS